MKRKLAVLLSVLLCAFGLTACSSSSASDNAGEDMSVYKTEAVTLINTLVNEQVTLDELKAEANDEDEATAYESGFNAWEDAKEELGEVSSEIKEDSASVSYENQNKLYVVSVDGKFAKRDAVVTVTFDKNGNVNSVAFNGVYTLGEKMAKAALNTVMGLAVVFVMLIFISLIIYCFKFVHEAEERAAAKKKAAEPAPAPAPAPAVEETVEEEDDLELVAVIAAAIAASEGTDPNGLVVRSIKRVGKTNNWKRA